jgi:hypothetical protein
MTQTAAEYMGASGHGVARTLTAFARDAQDFVGDNPLVVVALVALAIVFFYLTRPGTH